MPRISYLDDNHEQEETIMTDDNAPRRILVKAEGKTKISDDQFSHDVLVVASKLKKYIKDKHNLSTSGNVADRLSDIIRVSVDRAAENAKKDGRKTLMDRDF